MNENSKFKNTVVFMDVQGSIKDDGIYEMTKEITNNLCNILLVHIKADKLKSNSNF